MKNYDITRIALKEVLGWSRVDRSSHGVHYELWSHPIKAPDPISYRQAWAKELIDPGIDEPPALDPRKHGSMSKLIQAKHIKDWDVLSKIQDLAYIHPYELAYTWDILASFSNFPKKVILAKLKSLLKRGKIDGCACGCRGDWKLMIEHRWDI